MAKYTIEFYKLNDPVNPGIGFHNKIKEAFESIAFTNDYNNEHRTKLYEDFCAKYALHEIGFETPALFVMQLENKMRELYNKYDVRFYTLIDIISRDLKEPAHTVVTTTWGKHQNYDVSQDSNDDTTGTDKNTGHVTRSGSQTDTNDTRSIHDATPNKGINIDTAFAQNQYADDLTHSKSTDTTTYNNVKDDQYAEVEHGQKVRHHGTIKGGSEWLSGQDIVDTTAGHGYDMLAELEKFKTAAFSLDNEFIEEFKDLFMQVF